MEQARCEWVSFMSRRGQAWPPCQGDSIGVHGMGWGRPGKTEQQERGRKEWKLHLLGSYVPGMVIR